MPLAHSVFSQGCGVLRHAQEPGTYCHTRFEPPAAVAGWVQHFWVESWDLADGEPQVREVLPHPCVHLAFVRGQTRIYGVQLGRFSRELKGNGCVIGVKFRPGAFYPFLRKPVATIADTSFDAQQLFNDIPAAASAISNCHDERGMIDRASQFIQTHRPDHDPTVENVCEAVEIIATDRSVTRVGDLVARCGVQDRTLQRLFHRYVGASPNWVIKRYRIYDALTRLDQAPQGEWAELAQSLGYYDQAHFINDFKRLVGRSPSAYLKI
jgi:AraC-like DNA-binding protein